MTISNLDQLDDEGVAALYLVHIALRPSDDQKHSLQSVGEEIQSTLISDSSLLAAFTNNLGKAGWFKATKDQRESVGFRLGRRSIHYVTDKFPRIVKKDLLKFGRGVDLKTYRLNLAVCPEPLEAAKEDELWAQLRTAGGGNVAIVA